MRKLPLNTTNHRWAGRWQWSILALSTLALGSCQAPQMRRVASQPVAAASAAPAAMAAMAPPGPLPCAPTMQPLAIPMNACLTACSHDELLCDGGDAPPGVMVSPDWKIYGLNSQDTVAHYDTIDGRTLVEPSNCVCIYAPRFGAVRTIARVAASEQVDRPTGMSLPTAAAKQEDVKIPAASLQRLQAQGQASANLPEGFVARQNGAPLTSALMPLGFEESFLPYENFLLLRQGVYDSNEKARLSQAIDAAIVWTHELALQVTIEGQTAIALTGDTRAQATYTVKDLRCCPKLRVVKVASADTAKIGETVDFTIRFDNIGDQPLGNIVLVDNLTTRLDYVADSAQSSVPARFSSQPNAGESLVLRWEIADPIEPNQGGLVRFRCKVR